MGQDTDSSLKILTSPADFFREAVEEAFESRKIKALPLTKKYIIRLLEHYMITDNLFEVSEATGKRKSDTLAEMYLRAGLSEPAVRFDLLKKLGDTSLYISGFFGDSLKKKIVDIDYYAQMGGTAYAALAETDADNIYSPVYKEFSRKFLEYVDVLTYISQQSLIHSDEDLLRLYDRYVATGSKLAEEQLIEKGMLSAELLRIKGTRQ